MTENKNTTETKLSAFAKVRGFWHMLGPGLTTGAADDDPSGIATYSQAGSAYGFKYLWLSLFTFPLMAVVQEMCARIGLATGRGLAANIRLHFSKKVLFTCAILLFIANAFNIGADIGAMAAASKLIIPNLPFELWVVGFTFVSMLLQIFIPYSRYAKILKWLTLTLFTYVITGFVVHLPWGQVLKSTVLPSFSFDKNTWLLVTAVLGTTISPYLFFWQTSQEVEEEIKAGNKTVKARQHNITINEVKAMRIDVWTGMFISNIVMFFIIAVCAATLHANGITTIQTAEEAAMALRPLAGNLAYLLFTLGILGTGLLAIPVLAGSASYAISESLKIKEGLYQPFSKAIGFYSVIILAMLIGLGLNFVGIDPIKALIYSAVGNALVAPLVLALIVILGSKKHVMGQFKNGKLAASFGWIVTLLMTVAGVATIISLF